MLESDSQDRVQEVRNFKLAAIKRDLRNFDKRLRVKESRTTNSVYLVVSIGRNSKKVRISDHGGNPSRMEEVCLDLRWEDGENPRQVATRILALFRGLPERLHGHPRKKFRPGKKHRG